MPLVNRRIRVLIADDHSLLRDGIAVLISNSNDIEVAGEVATGREAVRAHRELRPDVTLMDLQMPDMDGIEAIAAIRSELPQARIIVLTTYSGDARAQKALASGARAYTLKNHVRRDLLDTIRLVFSGHRYVHPEVA